MTNQEGAESRAHWTLDAMGKGRGFALPLLVRMNGDQQQRLARLEQDLDVDGSDDPQHPTVSVRRSGG